LHVETLVGRADRPEQLEYLVSAEQLVVPLREEQHRAMDGRRVVRESLLGGSDDARGRPSTATEILGSAATTGRPRIVPIERPQ
jgi:hypothetical protein